ncbi:MAG: hypothetical protein UX35_C0003G0053 [Microgenomates group bacterium GW2011_GWA1_46_15]|nr:MAG: hypothetical protein UX00_C0004G0085 [Microgenomates group bacterium GW2011_GWB1_45_17]KKU23917.1 MAG: hypothetical protein UX35_C0003G0053 [Microgenomates group bacterium GW2011_GWA1_46_15]KKU24690.1 MAG: hypothetical protein UX36_C0001G0307 [Microgenomates group bacterium GW2011_GWC1_46_15]
MRHEQLGTRRPTTKETMLGRRIKAIREMVEIPFEKGVELRDLEGKLAWYQTQQDALHFFQQTQRNLNRFLATPRHTFERAKRGIVKRVTRAFTQYQRTHAVVEERRAEDAANQQEERRAAEETRMEALLQEYLGLDTMYRNDQDLTMEEGARYSDLIAYLSVKETQAQIVQTYNELSREFADVATSLERKARLATVLAVFVVFLLGACSGPGSVTPPPTQEATTTQVQPSAENLDPTARQENSTQVPEITPQVEQNTASLPYTPEDVFAHPEAYTPAIRIDEATLVEIAAIPPDQQPDNALIEQYGLLPAGAQFFLDQIARFRYLAGVAQTQEKDAEGNPNPKPAVTIKDVFLAWNGQAGEASRDDLLGFTDDGKLVILTTTGLVNGAQETYMSGSAFNYWQVKGQEFNQYDWAYVPIDVPTGDGEVTVYWNANGTGYIVNTDPQSGSVHEVLDVKNSADLLWVGKPESPQDLSTRIAIEANFDPAYGTFTLGTDDRYPGQQVMFRDGNLVAVKTDSGWEKVYIGPYADIGEGSSYRWARGADYPHFFPGFSIYAANISPVTLVDVENTPDRYGLKVLVFGFTVNGRNFLWRVSYNPCNQGKTISFHSESSPWVIGKDYHVGPTVIYEIADRSKVEEEFSVDGLGCSQFKEIETATVEEVKTFFKGQDIQSEGQLRNFGNGVILTIVFAPN